MKLLIIFIALAISMISNSVKAQSTDSQITLNVECEGDNRDSIVEFHCPNDYNSHSVAKIENPKYYSDYTHALTHAPKCAVMAMWVENGELKKRPQICVIDNTKYLTPVTSSPTDPTILYINLVKPLSKEQLRKQAYENYLPH